MPRGKKHRSDEESDSSDDDRYGTRGSSVSGFLWQTKASKDS